MVLPRRCSRGSGESGGNLLSGGDGYCEFATQGGCAWSSRRVCLDYNIGMAPSLFTPSFLQTR